MSDYIDEVFGAGGLLAKNNPGYEARDGQVAMARAVDRVINGGAPLVVEAPTATGKTYAYLVPAMRAALDGGARTIVATANIALQEQMIQKDLPALEKVMGPVPHALLKGRNNYLCRAKYRDALQKLLFFPDDEKAERATAEILDWGQRTVAGDVSELPVEPPARAWSQFSSTSEECRGKDCAYFRNCFGGIAQDEAKKALVIVTNYHMLLAHIKVVSRNMTEGENATGGNAVHMPYARVLPEWKLLICDEAHRFPDIARTGLGFRVTEGSIRVCARGLKLRGKDEVAAAVSREAEAFAATLVGVRDGPKYKVRIRKAGAFDPAAVMAAVERAVSVQMEIAKANAEKDKELASACRRYAAAGNRVIQGIGEAAGLKGDADGVVYYIERDVKGRPALCSRHATIGGITGPVLNAAPRIVMTSATMAAGADVGFVAAELGVRNCATLVVPSPFDYAANCLVVVPDGLPDPQNAGYHDAVAKMTRAAVDAAQGRTLGLFTSYKSMERAAKALEGVPHAVMRQGEMPRTELVRRFKRDVSSVLLGTASFWEGIDVPGTSLSCVVIDRIPFATPDDPVQDMIVERFPKRWFRDYAVPRAALAFKQGFGRLIRTRTDRGVVVVLDRRIIDRGYGREFLACIPKGVRVSNDIGDVRNFLDGKVLAGVKFTVR